MNYVTLFLTLFLCMSTNIFAPADDFDFDSLNQDGKLEQLSSILSTPEGQRDFSSFAKETLQEMMNHPEIMQNNPEMQQFYEQAQNNPDFLDSMAGEITKVVSDPGATKELFNNFADAWKNEDSGNWDDSKLDDNDSGDENDDFDDANFDMNFEDYDNLDDDYEEYTEGDDIGQEQAGSPTSVESKNDATSSQAQTTKPTELAVPVGVLTHATLSGDWHKVLLDRKADAGQRRAALFALTQDFNKMYKKLYSLYNSVDMTAEHLQQPQRKLLQQLFYQEGGLNDCAAALWTAASDEVAAQIFLDVFSKKDKFLEELTDFVALLQTTTQVVKGAAQENLQQGGIALQKSRLANEIAVRVKNLNIFVVRLASDMQTEFAKKPQLAEILTKKLVEAHGTQQKALSNSKRTSSYNPNYSSSYANPSYSSSYGGDSDYNDNGYYDDGSYYPDYGNNGYYDGGRGSSGFDYGSNSESSSGSGDSSPSKYSSIDKDAKDKKTSTELAPTLQAFLTRCETLNLLSPEKPIQYFTELENMYTALEVLAPDIEEFLSLIQLKRKTGQQTGGLEVRAQAGSADSKETDAVKKTSATGLSQKQLEKILHAMYKAKEGLKIPFAYSDSLQQNQKDKAVILQPPRFGFYFGEKGGIFADSYKAFINQPSADSFTNLLKSMAEGLAGQGDFIVQQTAVIDAITQKVGSIAKAQSGQFAAPLKQSFDKLEDMLLKKHSYPNAQDVEVLKHLDFRNAASLTDPKLSTALYNLKNCVAALEVLCLEYAIPYPLPDTNMSKLRQRAVSILTLLRMIPDKICNASDPSSLLAAMERSKKQAVPTQEIEAFFQGWVKSFLGSKDEATGLTALGSSYGELMQRLLSASVCWQVDTSWQSAVNRVQNFADNLMRNPQPDLPPEELEKLKQALQQNGGGILNTIMQHPVISGIIGVATAGLGALGVWKLIDGIKALYHKATD